jgi:hypothetical protein
MRLQWAPKTKNAMTYDEAILYCQFLEYNGYSDWRLPTRAEYLKDWCRPGNIIWVSDPEPYDYQHYSNEYLFEVCPVRETTNVWQLFVSILIDIKCVLIHWVFK